jgi:hypothetical protein
MFQFFHSKYVGYRFVICSLYIVENMPFVPNFFTAFIMRGCWILSNFVLVSVDVLFYSYWFTNAVQSCIPWMKPTWSGGMIFVKVLLDSVSKYFVEDFRVYVHQRYCPMAFFLFLSFDVSLPCLGIRVILDS